MTAPDSSGRSAWQPTVSAQVDEAKRQFEQEWQAGRTPKIEAYLLLVRPEARSALLRQLLCVELEERRKKRHAVAIDEYLGRFPDEHEVVVEVFRKLDVATSPREFVERLSGSGLLSNQDLSRLSASFPPGEEPSNLRDFIDKLSHQQMLTEFQSGAICFGTTAQLMLGEYVLLDRLGAGGMGEVFKAKHRKMKRIVAIKTISSQTISTAEAVSRFEREVEAAAKLDHPNIVAAYDAGEANGIHFLVMQYVDGCNLHDLVTERGAASVGEAADYALQAAHGLHYAHSHGVVHRDIKPGNLLLDVTGKIKILDMGLARIDHPLDEPGNAAKTELTGKGEVLGTADYMAPEQWQDTHSVDHRADIYSLGCTLYFLLAGHAPYALNHTTMAEKIAAHVLEPFPDISQQRDDVPPGLIAVLEKCVAKKPDERYASAEDLANDLAPFSGGFDTGSFSGGFRTREDRSESESTADGLGRGLAETISRGHVLWEDLSASPDVSAPLTDDSTPTKTKRPRWTTLAVIAGLVTIVAAAAFVIPLLLVPPDPQPKPTPPGDTDVPPEEVPPVLPDGPVGKIRQFEGHTARVNSIAFSPKGNIAASASDDMTAWLWNWETGKRIVELEGHPDMVTAVAFSSDASRLVTGCKDGVLRVWGGKTGEFLWEIRKNIFGGIICAAFLPDNKRVLTGGWDNSIRLWDVEAKQHLRKLEGVDSVVYSIAVDADGKRAISGMQDGGVRIWDIETGALIQSLPGHENLVASVAFSPDGNFALSGSWDKTVRMWNLNTGKEVLNVPADKVKGVGFFSNGRGIVFGDRSKRNRVWDVDANKQVAEFLDEGDVDCIAISHDGRLLLSGTFEGTICLWRLPQIPPKKDP